MRYMTKEEIIKREKKMKRKKKTEVIFDNLFSGLRTVIYTPLSIAFHAVSFIARGIGFISSFGLIVSVYYFYQSFCAFSNGTPLKEINTIEAAIMFLIFPFIAYGIAEITERIYGYFEDNAF